MKPPKTAESNELQKLGTKVLEDAIQVAKPVKKLAPEITKEMQPTTEVNSPANLPPKSTEGRSK